MAEKTLADGLLAGHERDLTLTFQGDEYPAWVLMEALLWIVDKDGNLVRFRLNFQQIGLYLEACDQIRKGEPIRDDILKARQIGFTTFIAGLFFLTVMFTPNVKVGIIADTLDHAQGIFDKCQTFYDHLDDSNPNREAIAEAEANRRHSPLSYKPELKWNKGMKSLATKYGNSVMEVMAVGDTAGASKTYQYLHCSECALWPDMKRTLHTLLHSVSRKNAKSMVFLETTARGFNEYKDRWDGDFAGHSSFRAHFEPWFRNPDYQLAVPEGIDASKELEPRELERQKRFGLTDRQMWWWHMEYLDSDKDWDWMLQEDPFDPVDAFISTGSSVFDRAALAARKAELVALMRENPPKDWLFRCLAEGSRDRSLITVSGISLEEVRGGPVRIFEGPDPSHPYVVTCDPNMGGSDDVAIQVVDNFTGRQCARFVSNGMSLDECAWQLYCLGRMYNWALVSSENNVGQIVIDLLLKAKYPRMYVEQSEAYENYRRTVKSSFGHKTTKANRQFMIDSLGLAFRQDPTMIRDYDTICEMETFQTVERLDREGNVTSSKQEAAGGCHDDLVMALAAFYQVRGQQSAVPTEAPKAAKDGMSVSQLEDELLGKRREQASRIADSGKDIGIAW